MGILDIFTIGKIIKDKNYTLDKYIYKAFVDYVPLYIVESILMGGFLFAGAILDTLLFVNSNLDITLILTILLFFGILFPINLYVLEEVPNINSKIIDKIITYAFIPVCIIINLIMIIYTLKCLFTWSLPDIDVFIIIFCIYFSTYLSVLLSNNIKDKNKLLIFNNKYILIFLSINVIMQLYSIMVRFVYYGITTSRMICLYIVIFEIISIILYYYRNKKCINKLIDVSFIIMIFACIIPFINIYELPMYYHGSRVVNYIENKNIDRKDAISSYNYLDNKSSRDKNISKYIKGNDLKLYQHDICFVDGVNQCKDYYTYANDDYFTYGHDLVFDMDISNYRRIRKVDMNERDFVLSDLKEAKVGNYRVNLYDFCKTIIDIKDDKEIDSYFDQNHIIVINDNTILVIDSVLFDIYNKKDLESNNEKNHSSDNYLSISGYILEK